jgi:hypothetical protein
MKKLEKLIEEIRNHILNEQPHIVDSYPWPGVARARYHIEGLPPVYLKEGLYTVHPAQFEVEIPFTEEEGTFLQEKIRKLYNDSELIRLREEEKEIQNKIKELTES